jgi:DNA-binding LacI/PurR family transcriptional regulator/DNA-binding transcriptional regulator YhcF (GntR family)
VADVIFRSVEAVSRRNTIQRSSPIPLFYQVAEDLKERLAAGEYGAGERLATVRELARAYGVSFVTAQRAIARLADERLVDAAPGRGILVLRSPAGQDREGQRPAAASGVKRVVLLWPTRQPAAPALQSQLSTIVDGIRSALPDFSLSLEFVDELLLEENAQPYLDSLASPPTNSGFCLVNAPPYVKRYFEQRRLPAVVLGDVEAGIDLAFVASDEEKAHYELTRHLLAIGHRQVAQIMPTPRVAGHEARVRGYRRALVEAGLADAAGRGDLTVTVPLQRDLAGPQFRHLMAGPAAPSAAICAGPVLASWLRGVAGDRLHLAYDVHGEPHESPPPRTTLLIWPGEEMGFAAGRLLREQIEGASQVRSETLEHVRIQDY